MKSGKLRFHISQFRNFGESPGFCLLQNSHALEPGGRQPHQLGRDFMRPESDSDVGYVAGRAYRTDTDPNLDLILVSRPSRDAASCSHSSVDELLTTNAGTPIRPIADCLLNNWLPLNFNYLSCARSLSLPADFHCSIQCLHSIPSQIGAQLTVNS